MNSIALALLCLCVAPVLSCSRGPQPERTSDIGERIAGTWLGTYEIEAAQGTRTAGIITYHADGTGTTSSERMFGAGEPDRHGLSGTAHLQWEAAGPREIRWRLLHFGYDGNGALTYISRTHGIREFDVTFESSRGTFRVEVFAPGALLDPLDPNDPFAEPLATTEGTDVARRLHVRIAAPHDE